MKRLAGGSGAEIDNGSIELFLMMLVMFVFVPLVGVLVYADIKRTDARATQCEEKGMIYIKTKGCGYCAKGEYIK